MASDASETDEQWCDDVIERADVLADLSSTERAAWVSGLFPLWLDDPSAAAALVDHCVADGGPVAAMVLDELARLAVGDLRAALAERGIAAEVDDDVEVAPTAWRIRAPFGTSIALSFSAPEAHTVLAELDDGQRLVDLQLAGPVQPLLKEVTDLDGRIEVEELDAAAAADAIAAAWREAGRTGTAVGPGVGPNQAFARARLAGIGHPGLDLLAPMASKEIDTSRGLDDDELRRANSAACATLRAALGACTVTDASPSALDAWATVVRGDVDGVTDRERDALLWLEWADWLGAGIGLVRAGPGADVSGAALVDAVNRCPEVSSSIDRRDRDYATWAFDVAMGCLADAGAVDNGRLSELGHRALWPALVTVWCNGEGAPVGGDD